MTTPPRPLRIVLVSPGFPPVRGGVEEHVGRLAAELAEAGHRVEVLTSERGLVAPRIHEIDGVRVTSYPAWGVRSMSVSPQLLLAALRYRTGDPAGADVLHVHSYHASNAAAVLNRSFRGRVVFTPHFHGGGHTMAARLLHRGYARVGRRLLAASSALICVSGAEREAIAAVVPQAGPVRVIPNGVAVEALRMAEPFATDEPTVLVVGRLEPYKQVNVTLEAFARMSGSDRVRLMIVGDGSAAPALRAQVQRLGLGDRVGLLGATDETTLHRWLRTAAVLVSLSAHEAFGMVPLEAAAAGARVVLSDIPAHRELAATYLSETAVLVDPRDGAAVAAAIEAQLAAAGRDGRDGRPAVTVPSWADVAAATVEVYTDLLGRPPAATEATTGAGTGRRIDPVDLPWIGFWSGLVAGPLRMPPVAQVRRAVLDFVTAHPDHVLACRLDAATDRWVPVPAAERSAFVESIVVEAGALRTDTVPEELARHRPPVNSTAPMHTVVAPDGLACFLSHAAGDAATFTEVILAVTTADPDRLAALDRRARLTDLLRLLPRQRRNHYRAWARRALSTVTPAATPAVAPTAATPAYRGETRPGAADGVLDNARLRELTRWRNAHHPGVSITAALASRTFAALTEAGVDVRADAFYSLFDLRPLLPDRAPTHGNLAKSLLLTADLRDPAAVDAAIRAALDARRALPALIGGAVATRLRRGGPHRPPQGPAGGGGPVTMTFSSMPTLPGLAALPWADGPRRYVGLGYPISADGISVFAVRFRDRMELSVSFDESRIDPARVRRAVAGIGVGGD